MSPFVRTEKTKIIDGNGTPVALKGVNLGGWLMMEGYILHAPNVAEQIFKKNFAKRLGQQALKDFEKSFRGCFIQEQDFKRIAELGFNCIRLPFNYRLVEKRPYVYDAKGLSYLDAALIWAKKYGIWVILDLHAAPGAQNHDWHSDSLGKADLWKRKDCQERVFALWEFLADRYKDAESVAGYDLLNESVIDNPALLNQFYKKVIKHIRSVDKNHIIFVEGNKWATDIACLDEFDDANLALSIHAYQPLDFTFNFVPHLVYPLGHEWNNEKLTELLSGYAALAEKRQRPVFVGEFGVNYREGRFNEHQWVADMLAGFKEYGFHWTYWTYKAVKHSVFPDGLFSYMANPAWVNRQGPVLGWDTYSLHWQAKKPDITASWDTDQFAANAKILEVLQNG